MSRKTLPRLLGAAATVVLLVVALTAIAGTGFAAGSAAQANYAPVNSAAPTISGTPQVGQTLTANPGTWNSDTTPTYTYQWQRCDTATTVRRSPPRTPRRTPSRRPTSTRRSALP
jgi:hypothetical protein